MTVRELMEILKDADPDMEVTVLAPDTCVYHDVEHVQYVVDEKDVTIDPYGCVTIYVG